jgi:hypothetical protein
MVKGLYPNESVLWSAFTKLHTSHSETIPPNSSHYLGRFRDHFVGNGVGVCDAAKSITRFLLGYQNTFQSILATTQLLRHS